MAALIDRKPAELAHGQSRSIAGRSFFATGVQTAVPELAPNSAERPCSFLEGVTGARRAACILLRTDSEHRPLHLRGWLSFGQLDSGRFGSGRFGSGRLAFVDLAAAHTPVLAAEYRP
jgi:hypothetical protein